MKENRLEIIPDKTWTLFLDRDGVINYEKRQDYIHTWKEFRFYENVPEAIRLLSEVFGKIIIVTNQKGVGKGLTRIEDLEEIHKNLTIEITKAGGNIDAIFFCPDINNDSENRKPNMGMAMQARLAFPEIEFNKSVMVGNTLSDMHFGRNIGSFNIFLPTTRPEVELDDPAIDTAFHSLFDAAKWIQKNKASV